jgi:hypothetical protein
MAVRRTQRLDESTVLGLLVKGDYAGLAKLTGLTVDQIERTLDGRDDDDPFDDDDDDDFFFGDGDGDGDEDDEDDEDGMRSPAGSARHGRDPNAQPPAARPSGGGPAARPLGGGPAGRPVSGSRF